MSTDQLILHIGTGKTGSSSIQAFLVNHQHELARRGWLVVTGAELDGEMTSTGAEWCSTEALEIALDSIERKRAASGCPNLLWTWEALCNRAFSEEIQRVQRIRDRLNANSCRVIIYLRRQDTWLNSAYLQWGLKDKQDPGPALNFPEWYGRLRADRLRWWRSSDLDYAQVLAPWATVFGPEQVVVRVFERDQMVRRSALDDFLSCSQLPVEGLAPLQHEVNRSYNLELHTLIGLYNSLVEGRSVPFDLLSYIEWSSQDGYFNAEGFSRFQIPDDVAKAVLQEFAPSNAFVAREYLNRVDGRLFLEELPASPSNASAELPCDATKLLPILLRLIFLEHQRNAHLDARVLALETSLEKLRLSWWAKAPLRTMRGLTNRALDMYWPSFRKDGTGSNDLH